MCGSCATCSATRTTGGSRKTPSRRGKGAGAELLQALLARAREDGYPAVSLSAEQGQTSFYERHGFETVRETPQAVTMLVRL